MTRNVLRVLPEALDEVGTFRPTYRPALRVTEAPIRGERLSFPSTEDLLSADGRF
jgi:hypothetical protein